MAEAMINSCRIYYESHGQGPPLIMIRGLGSSAEHWYEQVPALSRHFRVIVFDNRGIGRSGDDGEPFTIRDMARDAMGLLDALGVERAHVLGLSMGGMVAQEVALLFPQRVAGLVLVVTHCGGDRVVRAADEVMEIIQRLAVDDSLEARGAAATVFFAKGTTDQKVQTLRKFAAASARYPAGPDIMKRQMLAVAQHDTCDRLTDIRTPALVMAGTEDVLIPPENSKILAEGIPGAKLVMVPDGAHQVLIEQPEICNRAISDFLKPLGQLQ